MRTLFLLASITLNLPAMAAEPPPVSAFFRNATFSGARMSPDGRAVAFKAYMPGKGSNLQVHDLASKKTRAVAHFKDADIGTFAWVGADRLFYTVTNVIDYSQSVNPALPGVVGVNKDGMQMAVLSPVIEARRSFAEDPAFNGSGSYDQVNTLIGRVPVRGVDMLAIQGERNDPARQQAVTMNTVTGLVNAARRARAGKVWVFDEQLRVRAIEAQSSGKRVFEWRPDAGSSDWVRLFSKSPVDTEQMELAGIVGTQLYFTAREGKDTLGLYRYDAGADRLAPDRMVDAEGFDVRANLLARGDKLLGVRLHTDSSRVVWFDAAMKAHQEQVDKLLPDSANDISVVEENNAGKLLVTSTSSLNAANYYSYDIASKQLSWMGKQLDDFEAQHLGARELKRFAARDGLQVPVFVTVPIKSSGKKLPAVVLVEPNPFLRNTDWSFDRAAQFLASRGYLVLQPHPRGTSGYGLRHAQAGNGQWGLGMQDDLTDAVKWAVKEGLADPDRVCIAGTVYGGYAAMMGLVRHPELYQCAISWAGITDIATMLRHDWSFGFDAERIVGAKPDYDRLKAVSPLAQAGKIRKPVLLAYGKTDTGVPHGRGRALYEAIAAHNKQAQWISYDEGAQRAPYQDNRIDFWMRAEAFLARHLKSAAP